ncbi:interferon-induced protein 44-like isoform X2 [Acanthopagrus latus]|uniref:interferon-induced protein 44-like isoform X2 n=1 Tax=Acanthopagrus latus TaxID=8177 RepID=UPI00187D0394|nr:interferon-induced protein 44-like isoform X2 [Acanthopagrus latus]
MGGALLSQPWRTVPKSNKDNLDFVKSYKPRNNKVIHLRILLHGPAGAGKSSFINSVDSVLQGRVTGRVPTDATSEKTFTEQINPKRKMQTGDPSYNPSPTLDDKVHVLVSVIPAGSVTLLSEEVWKKMREVRLAARDMGIPQVAILTKVEKACAEANEDIKNVYKSKYLKEQVDMFSEMLGLPLNCIFLVRNYETKNSMNDGISALILCALRHMIDYGEDYLRDL